MGIVLKLLGSITGATVMLFSSSSKGSLVEEASLALIQQSCHIVEERFHVFK